MGLFISPSLGDGHYAHFADGKTEAPGRDLALLTSPRCYEAEFGFECKPVELHLPQGRVPMGTLPAAAATAAAALCPVVGRVQGDSSMCRALGAARRWLSWS